jgi:hypothetical protein
MKPSADGQRHVPGAVRRLDGGHHLARIEQLEVQRRRDERVVQPGLAAATSRPASGRSRAAGASTKSLQRLAAPARA